MRTLIAYLQLCRFPAVFTAMADVLLGFLLVHATLAPTAEFALLLASSSGLYLAGMVLNDVFDRRVDAAERPRRPIPSGRVSLRGAMTFAALLLAGGLLAAGLAQRSSLLVALLLAACILAYDGYLKRTVFGPVAMGGCRFLNIILGASTGSSSFLQAFSNPPLWVATGMGVYIAGVTWFARTEARESRRRGLMLAMLTVNLALTFLVCALFGWGRGAADPVTVLVLLAVVGLTVNRRMMAAIANPIPERVQTAVRMMLLSIITLDAALIYYQLGEEGLVYALGGVLLLIPASLLGRRLAIT